MKKFLVLSGLLLLSFVGVSGVTAAPQCQTSDPQPGQIVGRCSIAVTDLGDAAVCSDRVLEGDICYYGRPVNNNPPTIGA